MKRATLERLAAVLVLAACICAECIPLLLALVAGLSINGTFAALFSSIVPFSVFPIISLVLTVYCLHQRYLNRTMPVGLPGLAAACLLYTSPSPRD